MLNEVHTPPAKVAGTIAFSKEKPGERKAL